MPKRKELIQMYLFLNHMTAVIIIISLNKYNVTCYIKFFINDKLLIAKT